MLNIKSYCKLQCTKEVLYFERTKEQCRKCLQSTVKGCQFSPSSASSVKLEKSFLKLG